MEQLRFDENIPCTETPSKVNVVASSPIIIASPKIMFSNSSNFEINN